MNRDFIVPGGAVEFNNAKEAYAFYWQYGTSAKSNAYKNGAPVSASALDTIRVDNASTGINAYAKTSGHFSVLTSDNGVVKLQNLNARTGDLLAAISGSSGGIYYMFVLSY